MRTLILSLLLLLTTLAGCADEAPEEIQEAEMEEPPTPPAVLLLNETFTGSLPAPDPEVVTATYTVAVPDNATKMEVLYEATYTGAWPAVLSINDPSGEERASSLDGCSAAAGAMETSSCTLKVSKPKEGDWTLELTWQVGEANQDHTIVASVWGHA